MALHQQNSEISMEFEGSEAEMMKFPVNLKVLRVSLSLSLSLSLGRRRESLLGGEERPQFGSNIVENVRFGRLGAISWTLGTSAHSRPVLPDPPALVPGPQNEGWQPTGPTYWTKPYCMFSRGNETVRHVDP